MKAILITFFLSMMPVLELRGGVPVGMCMGLPAWKAVLLALAGNALSMLIFLWLLPIVVELVAGRWVWLHKLLLKVFAKTRASHSKTFERLEHIGLVLFVGIPFPGTGTYTGAVIAYLFGMSYKRAARDMMIGLVISALIMGALGSVVCSGPVIEFFTGGNAV